VRWSLFLSKFNFFFTYRKGSENACANALSQHDQDAPTEQDKQIQSCTFQLFQPERNHGTTTFTPTRLALAPADFNAILATTEPITWEESRNNDLQYLGAIKAIQQGLQQFPPELNLKLSLAECAIDNKGYLTYRKR
jgi:hypothetical protein